MAKNVLTANLSEPRNGIMVAKVVVDPGDGNLVVDGQTGSEEVLANGTLQYLENQEEPIRTLSETGGQTTFTLTAHTRQSWFHFPWSACNGATVWHVHVNPKVSLDLTARSAGGNIKLDLAGTAVTRVSAGTGGGNIEVILPDCTADLSVAVKTGAGNVVLVLPDGVAARIYAGSGLGKVIMDPRFAKVDKGTYQSPDYDGAAVKVEIDAKTGAGNVSVSLRESVASKLVGLAG